MAVNMKKRCPGLSENFSMFLVITHYTTFVINRAVTFCFGMLSRFSLFRIRSVMGENFSGYKYFSRFNLCCTNVPYHIIHPLSNAGSDIVQARVRREQVLIQDKFSFGPNAFAVIHARYNFASDGWRHKFLTCKILTRKLSTGNLWTTK